MSEILAPAGGKNSAIAAINSGADAIYLGLDRYSARSSAENFDLDSFEEICAFAHSFGVKVYAALNTLVKSDELKSFLSFAVEVWNRGADAIILQDLYIGKFLKTFAPEIKIHLSTQAGVCNALGAMLAKEAGFDRVILARETKLEDIKEISKIIQTEAFIQGALCTCFSGQCYMSSFAGGNSGNRGKCKQPCRKLYSIDRQGFENFAYRLSLSDLCVGENINALIDSGVSSFKIEGRMRRPEYVSAAVDYYRKIINGDTADLSALKRTFNRGNYTKGLAFGQDKNFISSAVQGHIGEFAGIIKVENAKYICQSNCIFSNGDGFKILRGGSEVGGGTYGGAVKGGFTILTRDRLKNGDKVFITTDTKLNSKLLSKKRLINLNISANFTVGNKAAVEINGKQYFGEKNLEQANSKPLSAEDIKTCFEKVDLYPFKPVFESILTDNVFITKSELNALRRNIYADYYSSVSASSNAKITPHFEIPKIKCEKNDKTAVICTDLKGIEADIAILKLSNLSADVDKLLSGFKGEKYLFVPPYLTGAEVERFFEIALKFDGIYCDSYFGIKLAEKLGKHFFAGTGLNIANSVALNSIGAKYVALSKELTVSECDALSGANTFRLSAGNLKVMDLIYCPFEKKCSSCDKRGIYTLTDSDGRKFTLRRYKTGECRFEVYNCADLVSAGGSSGKLYDLTLVQDAEKVLRSAKNNSLEKIFTNFTRGHSVNGIY